MYLGEKKLFFLEEGIGQQHRLVECECEWLGWFVERFVIIEEVEPAAAAADSGGDRRSQLVATYLKAGTQFTRRRRRDKKDSLEQAN